MNTTENNKIIAEFMGANPFREYPDEDIFSYEMYGIIESINDGENEKHFYLPEQMLFSSDWNWLMEVVEKVKETQPFITFDLSFFGCEIKLLDFANNNSVLFSAYPKMNTQDTKMIDCVYNAVLNYIHWYNEQKEK